MSSDPRCHWVLWVLVLNQEEKISHVAKGLDVLSSCPASRSISLRSFFRHTGLFDVPSVNLNLDLPFPTLSSSYHDVPRNSDTLLSDQSLPLVNTPPPQTSSLHIYTCVEVEVNVKLCSVSRRMRLSSESRPRIYRGKQKAPIGRYQNRLSLVRSVARWNRRFSQISVLISTCIVYTKGALGTKTEGLVRSLPPCLASYHMCAAEFARVEPWHEYLLSGDALWSYVFLSKLGLLLFALNCHFSLHWTFIHHLLQKRPVSLLLLAVRVSGC